jgi:hypothetical protein
MKMYIVQFYAHLSVHRESVFKNVPARTDSPMTTEGRILFATTRCCNYSFFEFLMMGEYFTQNM